MNIPKYWAKAEENVRAVSHDLRLRCWGWSQRGMEEAKSNARMALLRLADRVRSGAPFPERYAYSDRALREEIIREIPSPGAQEPAAVITRNSYGSLVLNTADVMFVDVDAAPPPKAGGLAGLFRKKSAEPFGLPDQIRDRAARLGIPFRVYRTAAGFRIVALDRKFDPGSGESEEVMRALDADPKFLQLCRAQKSFRARLTPKPWRCGWRLPPSTFPRESREAAAFDKWLYGYDEAGRSYATCALLETIGSGRVSDEVSRMLTLHDEFTRSGSGLPLA
jgi:hypothetical protein